MKTEPRMIAHTATRRRFLRVAALGAAGRTLPLRSDAAAPGASFTFAVANDLHYRDARCGEWLGRVTAHLRQVQPRPAFVVLAGDLSEDGAPEQLGAVRRLFGSLPMPVRALIGNHDHTLEGDRAAYERLFGPQLNYRFDHGGCQFLVLDTTEGRSVYRTRIAPSTLAWVDGALPTLSRNRPSIILTHFPLGRNWLRPTNTRQLLARFREHQLVSTFSGHWHGLTERQEGPTHLSTGRCCSWWRENHDGSDEKGYTLCTVSRTPAREGFDWTVEHRFIAVA